MIFFTKWASSAIIGQISNISRRTNSSIKMPADPSVVRDIYTDMNAELLFKRDRELPNSTLKKPLKQT